MGNCCSSTAKVAGETRAGDNESLPQEQQPHFTYMSFDTFFHSTENPTVCEYLFKKPRKTTEEILLITRDVYLVSIAQSLSTDISEFIILKAQKPSDLTYSRRLVSHLVAYTIGLCARYGVNYALRHEVYNKKELLYKIPLNILVEAISFAFTNLEETARIIRPYSPEIADAIDQGVNLMNPKSSN